MSFEADAFVGTNFIGGGQTATFTFFHDVDDAFWSISVVPQGTNNSVQIVNLWVDSDAGSTRRLHYTVQNNTANPTNFTRGAVRIPNA
jgi:hypothetical protein